MIVRAALAFAVLGACRTAASVEPPAYVVRHTPESRLALDQAVTQALGGVRVTLADDALTTSGVLVVEPPARDDPRALTVEGRDPAAARGRDERFHLVKLGERCVLVHDRTDRHYELIGTACAPR